MTAFDAVSSLSDKITSFQIGAWETYAWWPKAWFYIQVFFWMTAFIFGALIFWKYYLQYKIRVSIKICYGGNIINVKKDKAKIIRDEQGKLKLQLLKTRKGKNPYSCPVPESKYKMKEGKLDYYELTIDDNQQMHPIKVGIKSRMKALYSKKERMENHTVDKYNLKPIKKLTEENLKPIEWIEPDKEKDELYMQIKPQDREAWNSYEEKRIIEKSQRKTWLQEYMPLVVYTTLGVVVLLTFYFFFKQLGGGMASLANSFSAIARSCVSLG